MPMDAPPITTAPANPSPSIFCLGNCSPETDIREGDELNCVCAAPWTSGWPSGGRDSAAFVQDSAAFVQEFDQPSSATVTGEVAVITRTKNRPLLLARALESVRQQTFTHFVWVIVNDGGEQAPVDAIAAEAKAAGIHTLVVHNPESLGMEAASNKAIHAVDSQYIVIHDDDDSWEPNFLECTTAFLQSNPSYAGVITHSWRVVEKIATDGVQVIAKYPFNGSLSSIYLIDILNINSYPPISFLYKRNAFNAVGDYDRTLPVLGDWDFNIRFLKKYNVGVVPKLLANYHHRLPAQERGAYANSVVAGANQHTAYDAIIRNRMLRQDLEEGQFGVGCLMSVMRWQRNLVEQQNLLTKARQALARVIRQLSGSRRWLRRR